MSSSRPRYIRPRMYSNAMAKAWMSHQLEEGRNLEQPS